MMITWAYLAGFIDGDGWITVRKNKNCKTKKYVVGLTQSSKEKECPLGIKGCLVNIKKKYPIL